ncbi:TetR/AcrR family transcriptional regulator [Nocardia sp. NPDC050175]|uniref:TetR/AcrR family transcriptional regulator n=1 Tax=Nocardia sp. NPDC050175 TaxID=3364317 RepID=UPI003791371F
MSQPVKRPRQPRMQLEVRREQVLDAALRLVTQHGYAAITMEAVSREAELAKPRVYAAYPGVEPLLLALFDREGQRALATLAEAMPTFADDAEFDDILVAAMTNLLTAVLANPDSWRLLLLPAVDAPSQVRERSEAAMQFALDQMRALLEWGRDRRPGLADMDLELLAMSLIAAGERAGHQILTDPEQFNIDRYERFARSMLGALAPR